MTYRWDSVITVGLSELDPTKVSVGWVKQVQARLRANAPGNGTISNYRASGQTKKLTTMFVLDMSDEDVARRAAKALSRAITLCGGRHDVDPFQ
jgi:hypothetical protein